MHTALATSQNEAMPLARPVTEQSRCLGGCIGPLRLEERVPNTQEEAMGLPEQIKSRKIEVESEEIW